ncbi:MAG: hypothetical protein LBR86_06240, partial [Tannerella sp.]|nr:hypothetical protein [Tannerella sp.]
MKRMFRFYVCAAILAAGFTGCTSDGEGPGPKPPVDASDVVEGIPTYATFRFQVSGEDLSGRALTGDAGGDSESTKVKDVRLLIYNAKDSCEVNEIVTGGDPIWGSTNAPKSKTVRVTSGNKKIFV